MGSGVIYAVIVVLWAVVLVPMWLRRHDTETEVRSVDRFSKAMGILSLRGSKDRSEDAEGEAVAGASDARADGRKDDGRTGSGSERSTVTSTTPQRLGVELSSLSFGPRRLTPLATSVFVSRPRSAQRRDAHAAQMRRRRRVLLGLGALLVATGVLFGLGFVMLWAPAFALALSAGYLVVLRRYALADARERREAQRHVRRSSDSARAPRQIDLSPQVPSTADVQPTVVLERPDPVATGREATAAASGWQPQSMPLPTYVTAPTATAFPRVIDRADAQGWTAQHMVARAEADRLASAAEVAPTQDVWPRVTSPDDVFDREFFESGMERDGFAEVVVEEAELLDSERPRRRHASHDEVASDFEHRQASGH